MHILSKSGIDRSQLKERRNKGSSYMELHLGDKDIERLEQIGEIISNIESSGMECLVVHSPMALDYKLEALNTYDGYLNIERVLNLAYQLSVKYDKGVHVVLHHEMKIDRLKMWGMYDNIRTSLSLLLTQFPRITVNIENEGIVELKSGIITVKNSHTLNPLELVKSFRKDLKTTRVGLVLDTCHVTSSNRILSTLSKEVEELKIIPIMDIFKETIEYINVIHLCGCKGFGIGANHGVGFGTREDKVLLEYILVFLKESNYDRVVTLEVLEEDYLNAVRYKTLMHQIDEMKDRIGLEYDK